MAYLLVEVVLWGGRSEPMWVRQPPGRVVQTHQPTGEETTKDSYPTNGHLSQQSSLDSRAHKNGRLE